MFSSSQSQLTFDDTDLDLISQPNDYSQLNFNDFTMPSQTQASQGDYLSNNQVIVTISTDHKFANSKRFALTHHFMYLILSNFFSSNLIPRHHERNVVQ